MHLLYTIICECTTLYNTSVIPTPYKTPHYTSRTCIRVYNNIIVRIFYYILSTMCDTPQYTGSVLLDTVCTRFFCNTEALWSEVTFWEYGKVIVVLCRCVHYAYCPFRTLPSATVSILYITERHRAKGGPNCQNIPAILGSCQTIQNHLRSR